MAEKFIYDGVEYTLPSPNGLVFQSVAALHRHHVRNETPIYDSGVRIGTTKELCAEFGDMDSPVFHDADGVYGESGADYFGIRGNFIDTKVQAEKKGWSDEERALVEKALLVGQNPSDFWLHTKPPVGKPWPTYDSTPAADIANLASTLGLVAEALMYERENKNRKSVVEALGERASKQVEAEAEELAAA